MTNESPLSDTRLVHVGPDPRDQGGYVNVPVHRASTLVYRDLAELSASQQDEMRQQAKVYGRFGTPTTRAFERALAELEGGHAAVATCSGLAAVTTALLAFVRPGDHVLLTRTAYGPAKKFCDFLTGFGVVTELYDPGIGAGIREVIQPNTRLVYLESPGSSTFDVQDVPAITAVCRARGITTLADNTWATPVFSRPIELGVDVVIHSATKFLTGHSDSLLGAIVCTPHTYSTVRTAAIRLGQCAGAEDSYLGLRGLRTLGIRLRAHQTGALRLATWLREQAVVVRVMFPALPDDPGHDLWRRDFTGAAGPFSVEFDATVSCATVASALESFQLFSLGHSYGGFESLVVPIERTAGGSAVLLRFHVGLEDPEDLLDDLRQFFVALRSNN